mmetsp:Transcript_9142/g.22023  ORF Transcript_9142/g.22023 Transcript_9142/m.22023 type:complete len:276 (+) Transcript_9142:1428-2255(+)
MTPWRRSPARPAPRLCSAHRDSRSESRWHSSSRGPGKPSAATSRERWLWRWCSRVASQLRFSARSSILSCSSSATGSTPLLSSRARDTPSPRPSTVRSSCSRTPSEDACRGPSAAAAACLVSRRLRSTSRRATMSCPCGPSRRAEAPSGLPPAMVARVPAAQAASASVAPDELAVAALPMSPSWGSSSLTSQATSTPNFSCRRRACSQPLTPRTFESAGSAWRCADWCARRAVRAVTASSVGCKCSPHRLERSAILLSTLAPAMAQSGSRLDSSP